MQKGRKLRSHIHNIKEVQKTEKNTEIHAKCVRPASIHKTEYKLDFEINSEREVLSAWCSCTAGKQAKCKHLGALITAVNLEREESKTDQGCKWYKPSEKSKELYPKGKTFEDIFHLPKPTGTRHHAMLDDEKKKAHLAVLEEVGDTSSMMYQLLTVNVQSSTPAPLELPDFVEEIFSPKTSPFRFMVPNGSKFSSEVSLLSNDSREFYNKCIQVVTSKSKEICR